MTYLAKLHLLSGRSLKSYIYFILCSYWVGYKDIRMPLGFYFFEKKKKGTKNMSFESCCFPKKAITFKIITFLKVIHLFFSFLAFDVYGSTNNGSLKKRTFKPQKCYVS